VTEIRRRQAPAPPPCGAVEERPPVSILSSSVVLSVLLALPGRPGRCCAGAWRGLRGRALPVPVGEQEATAAEHARRCARDVPVGALSPPLGYRFPKAISGAWRFSLTSLKLPCSVSGTDAMAAHPWQGPARPGSSEQFPGRERWPCWRSRAGCPRLRSASTVQPARPAPGCSPGLLLGTLQWKGSFWRVLAPW